MIVTNEKNQEFFMFQGAKLINNKLISEKIQRTLETNAYEKIEVDITLAEAEPDDVILELGAGIGALSSVVLLHKQVKDYICIEANPQMIHLIKKNHALNEIKNCTVLPGVMTNEAEPAEYTFYLCHDFWESSLIEPRQYESTVQVPGYTFTTFLKEHRPTFLVCDIEGGEFGLFSGALTMPTVNKVCIEIHAAGKRELIDLYAFFMDQGFILETQPYRVGVNFFRRRATSASIAG